MRNVINLKAHKRLLERMAQSDAKGWSTRPATTGWTPDRPVNLYSFDLLTGALVFGVLNRDEFERSPNAAPELSDEDVFNLSGSILGNFADGTLPMGGSNPHPNELAVFAAFLYAGRTQSFRALPGDAKGVHFVVMLYRRARGQNDPMLRPFPLISRSSDAPLSPSELMGHVQHVVEIDRERHPEWFLPKAELIPFPVLCEKQDA